MAHFAQLDANNVVLRVVAVANDVITDEQGLEQENIGIGYLFGLLGGRWKQTSYNANFRSKYAGIGDTYDAVNDVFVAPVTESETPDGDL
jgi:hypothetical protein